MTLTRLIRKYDKRHLFCRAKRETRRDERGKTEEESRKIKEAMGAFRRGEEAGHGVGYN